MVLHQNRPRSNLPPASASRRLIGAAMAGVLVFAALPAQAAAAGTSSAESGTVVSDWNAIAMTTLAGDTTKAPQETFLYTGFVHAATTRAPTAARRGELRPPRRSRPPPTRS